MRRSLIGALGILAACFACAGESERTGSDGDAAGDSAGADAGESSGGSAGTSGGASQGGSATGGIGPAGADTGGTDMGGRAPGTGGMAGDIAARAGSGGSTIMAGTGGSSGVGNSGTGGAGNSGTGGCGASCSGSSSGGSTSGGNGNDIFDNDARCPVQAQASGGVSIPPPFECAPNQDPRNPQGCYYNSSGCLCTEGRFGAFCECVHPDSTCGMNASEGSPGSCEVGVGFSTLQINFCGCSTTGTFYCTIV